MTPSQHVGSRIRLYRTQRRLTLTELSRLISRSPSTVSKYESGKITVDIDTLFEIADVLNVSVSQLTDYVKPDTVKVQNNHTGNFFQRKNFYYMYSYWGVEKRFYVCALEMIRTPDEIFDKIILYYDIKDTQNYSNSNYIYTGCINYFDLHTTMTLENPYNKGDKLFIYAKAPFHTNGTSNGILLGLSSSIRTPCSFKVIFSESVLEENSTLRDSLNLAHKDILAEIRRTNCLLVY